MEIIGDGTPYPPFAELLEQSRPAIIESCHLVREERTQLEATFLGGLPFENGLYPILDAAVLFTMIKRFRPERYIEVGSGYSTCFARQAFDRDKIDVDFTSVDPRPQLPNIDQFCTRVFREPFENVWNRGELQQYVDALGPGDIFFWDSQHHVRMDNEYPVFFCEVLPRLKPGVVVHIHDIYLPWSYPVNEATARWAEQPMLLMLLRYLPEFKILFPTHWVQRVEPDPDLRGTLLNSRHGDCRYEGSSFWLYKES